MGEIYFEYKIQPVLGCLILMRLENWIIVVQEEAIPAKKVYVKRHLVEDLPWRLGRMAVRSEWRLSDTHLDHGKWSKITFDFRAFGRPT